MFNSTHTFVALAINRTGPEKWARSATATAVIASNLPDLDSIAGFWGTAAYLDHHRGLTHSLPGIVLLSILLSAVMYFFSGNFRKTFAIALIAMATHPALDYLNSYGLRPWLPWNGQWYYGDALFIIDPYIDAVLLAGLLWGSLRPKQKRRAAFLALLLATAYVGFRLESQAIAKSQLDEMAVQFPSLEQTAVLPQIANLFVWDAILESKEQVVRFDIRPFLHYLGSLHSPDLNYMRMARGPSSELVAVAAASSSAAAFLRFARFPVVRIEPIPEGHRVTFLDFRFFRRSMNTALAAEIILDQSLRVAKESLSFTHRITVDEDEDQ
jgi:inner membrane protein